MSTALALLVSVGFLIALTVNLAKGAAAIGITGPEFAFWMALGAGVVLLVFAAARGERPALTREHLVYYALAGLLAVAAPNYIGFEVAARAGAAYASVPYALSPLITYALAVSVRIDAPSGKRIAGLVLGCLGTALVVANMIARADGTSPAWLFAALLVPLSVAFGNVHRTLYWPKGSAPMALAAAMLLAGALWLSPFVAVNGTQLLARGPASGSGAIIAAQVSVSALMYVLYFQLQRVAGPVYLSQIGYVAAGFGVAIAVAVFAETVTLAMLAGLALIAGGVFLVTPRRSPA
ncbi:hypothetical protein BOQ54_05935 [Chelatococcus daeguensis]|uniref:EamA domain-containing protein n=1 Tax=Chelatococcus daeguensis TaxID=444444 RepID=A0AAC9JR85_9HYPH|nr:DMT family transporter [Chelatococcus daeguensis]APF36924.1 hypothetical protein BOQ54_05935 [Chelatococcus daeguensis]